MGALVTITMSDDVIALLGFTVAALMLGIWSICAAVHGGAKNASVEAADVTILLACILIGFIAVVAAFILAVSGGVS